MKRLTLLVGLLSALTFGVAAPAAAAEREVRVVQFTPGFRQNLVDYTRVTYDPETALLRVYLTTHCFVQTIQFDPEMEPVSGQSSVRWIDWTVSQRGRVLSTSFADTTQDHATVRGWETDPTVCHRDWVFEFEGVAPGSVTIWIDVNQIAWNDVDTATTLRVVVPSR